MVTENGTAEIVGRIYAAAMANEPWHDLLNGIADFCGGANAALVTVDPDIAFSSVVTPRGNLDSMSAYNRYWWKHDPITRVADKAPPGRFVSVADVDEDAYFSSTFYNEFRRHTGFGDRGITTKLFQNGNAISNFVLQTSRRRDKIDADALRKAKFVVPHLERAVAITRKIRRLEFEREMTALEQATHHAGLVLVTAAGRRIHADEEAERLIAANSGIVERNGRIALADPAADKRLQAAIHDCAHIDAHAPAGNTIRVPRGPDMGPLTIEVLAYRANHINPYGGLTAAMLLLREPAHTPNVDVEAIMDRFGLTPAEAKLTMEVVKGDGRAAAARRCGITVNTARTHLMRVFEKTGVHRQAELISKIMSQ